MGARSVSHRLISAGLGLLLVSCSARNLATPSTETLSRYVLIIQETSEGHITHAWQPAEAFNLPQYQYRTGTHGIGGRVVLASWTRDCEQELHDCYRECMSRPLAPHDRHRTSVRGKGGKAEYCNEKCNKAYNDCCRLRDLEPQRFTAVDSAVDWLKRNRRTILVGTAVVIAGVVFVVVSAGAGLVVLAPVVLVASAETPPGLPTAEGSP